VTDTQFDRAATRGNPVGPDAVLEQARQRHQQHRRRQVRRARGTMLAVALVVFAGVGVLARMWDDTSPRAVVVGPAAPPESSQDGAIVTTTHTIVLPSVDAMTDAWKQVLRIPYGDAPNELARSTFGPEYGAPAPGGTWWMLDTHKGRAVQFALDGSVQREVPLDDGSGNAGFQIPQVLDDGTLTMHAHDLVGIIRDGTLTRHRAPGAFWLYTDGRLLYRRAGSRLVTFDPATGQSRDAPALRARNGDLFNVSVDESEIAVDLLGARRRVVLRLRPGAGRSPALTVAEIVSLRDGTIVLYIYGSSDRGEGAPVAALLTIRPDGSLGPVEPTQPPQGALDPGSASHLHASGDGTRPTLLFITPTGVEAYERTG
jgi:hypothetical protein